MSKPTSTTKEHAQEMLWHVADTLSFLQEVAATTTDEGWSLSQSGRDGLARILDHCKSETLEVISELGLREDSHHA